MKATADTFRVLRCPDGDVRKAIETEHYLEKWPDPRALPFAYRLVRVNGRTGTISHFGPDGRPWGAVVFSLLQHHRQKGLFGYDGLPTCWQVLNLARVWCHPAIQQPALWGGQMPTMPGDPNCPNVWIGTNRKGEQVAMQTNAFSRMVAMAIRQVQRDWIAHHPPVFPELPYHITLIVSYCDRAHHQGNGYRASGFTKFGETSDGSKDVYVRHLKQPRWKWTGARQMSFEEAWSVK